VRIEGRVRQDIVEEEIWIWTITRTPSSSVQLGLGRSREDTGAQEANNQDAAGPVTVRTSKFITNRLLNRKQFVVTILHPTRPNLSRDELSDKLAALYKTEKKRVVVFGLKTKFGGGSTQGFGLIYDDEESQKKFEPKYRLVRVCSIYFLIRAILMI
jgi:ribosomal protein S24E